MMIVNRKALSTRSLLLLSALPVFVVGCKWNTSGTRTENHTPHVAVTLHPLRLIVRELIGERISLSLLVPLGVSPHAFEPRPTHVRDLEKADLVIHADAVLDGWVRNVAEDKSFDCMKALASHPHNHSAEAQIPGHMDHHHGSDGIDPHFWTDPLEVKELLPFLVEALSSIDPDGREIFQANARDFAARLDEMHANVRNMLEHGRGLGIVLFHPSFVRYFNRYNLKIAGIIEPAPGREPTPREFQNLATEARSNQARAIVTEPQLPKRPALALADATELPLLELDPLGDRYGSDSYGAWLMINTRLLAEALR